MVSGDVSKICKRKYYDGLHNTLNALWVAISLFGKVYYTAGVSWIIVNALTTMSTSFLSPYVSRRHAVSAVCIGCERPPLCCAVGRQNRTFYQIPSLHSFNANCSRLKRVPNKKNVYNLITLGSVQFYTQDVEGQILIRP